MTRLVVFGATSAISQAYIDRVALRYDNIVLVARNSVHLEQVAEHVSAISDAQVSKIVWDLSATHTHAELFQQLAISVDTGLICYGELSKQDRCVEDAEYAEQQFRLNGTSAISLARLTAGLMVKEKRGVVAVVGSVAGDRGRKSNYHYGAAKGALDTFLSGLRGDVLSAGVRVITVKPGFVDTPMTKDIKKGLLWASPEKVASDIDRAITGRADIVYTPWFWRYIMLVIRALPEFLFKKLSI